MKTKEEILDKIIADEGLKFWEAHTDNFNRKIAMKAMDIFASQSLSSKIEEVREKVTEKEISDTYRQKYGIEKDNFYEGAKWMRDLIISSLEGEKG